MVDDCLFSCLNESGKNNHTTNINTAVWAPQRVTGALYSHNITMLWKETFIDNNKREENNVLECFEDENHALSIGELLEKQANIYKILGVPLPTSSC